jgi:hypothetical protein
MSAGPVSTTSAVAESNAPAAAGVKRISNALKVSYTNGAANIKTVGPMTPSLPFGSTSALEWGSNNSMATDFVGFAD